MISVSGDVGRAIASRTSPPISVGNRRCDHSGDRLFSPCPNGCVLRCEVLPHPLGQLAQDIGDWGSLRQDGHPSNDHITARVATWCSATESVFNTD